MKDVFYANVIDSLNGPDSKIAYMLIENKQFMLVNNAYGNSLKGATKEAKIFLPSLFEKMKLYF